MQDRQEPHLMIYRWFGQRWDCEGEELAVAVFVHDLLQNQREGGRDRKAASLKEWRIVLFLTVWCLTLMYIKGVSKCLI